MSIIDEFSKWVAVYPIQTKANIFQIFIEHIKRTEQSLNTKVEAIKNDNGTEFVNNKFDTFCRENGIKHNLTNYYSPDQNGSCERFNQTIMDGARTVLSESKLPNHFWPDAALYFAYTFNRICHSNQNKTPFELYLGYKPSVRHLKP